MIDSPLVKAIRDAIRDLEYEGISDGAEILASSLKEALKEESIVGYYQLMRVEDQPPIPRVYPWNPV